MDKKNLIIGVLTFSLLAITVLFFYNSQKQKEMYLKTMKSLQYSLNRGEGKGKDKDPYKEIAVNNSLRKKVRVVQDCYNRFIATNPKQTDGFVEIDWIINENGVVKRAELISSDLNDNTLNTCILEIIKNIKFPPPPTGAETYMTYKYYFKKDNEKK
ncbi:MAG: AgmX/PglI C-terminal domain-containing protein [Leptospiraceae bacterium]|nr:AgmX/PglI C-terminal domain-containing protein [Leptospiraceae bacterium]